MPEVSYIRESGKSVLLLDFAGLEDYSVLSGLVEEAIRLARIPNEWSSVLSLIDLTGTKVNSTVLESLKKLSRSNGPYIKAIAFVGLSPMRYLMMKIILRITGRRNHRVIRNRGEALLWLLQQ